MSKPWFLAGTSEEACPTSTASSVGCNGPETQIWSTSWCHVDSKNDGHKRNMRLVWEGEMFCLKRSLSKKFGDIPQIAGAMLIPYQDSWLPKGPRGKPPPHGFAFGCEFQAHMTRVGRQGGLHPPVLWGLYKGGHLILNPDCWWGRKSSSSSDGVETRLGVSINILLFAWHLDIHRWWFLSDFGGSIVVLEHEEMEQTDASELGAHRGYASWVWRLWRNLTPSWSPKTRQNIS